MLRRELSGNALGVVTNEITSLFSFSHYYNDFMSFLGSSREDRDLMGDDSLSHSDILKIFSQVGDGTVNIAPLVERLFVSLKSSNDEGNADVWRVYSEMFKTLVRFYEYEVPRDLSGESGLSMHASNGYDMTLPMKEYEDERSSITIDNMHMESPSFVCTNGESVFFIYGVMRESGTISCVVVEYVIFMGTVLIPHGEPLIIPDSSSGKTTVTGVRLRGSRLYLYTDERLRSCLIIDILKRVVVSESSSGWYRSGCVCKCCSDGISDVQVTMHGSVKVEYKWSEKSNSVTLVMNEKDNIMKKTNILVETNGFNVMFIRKSQMGETCVTVFRRDSGEVCQYAELQDPGFQIVAITFDTVNSCHWAVVQSDSGIRLTRIRARTTLKAYLVRSVNSTCEMDALVRQLARPSVCCSANSEKEAVKPLLLIYMRHYQWNAVSGTIWNVRDIPDVLVPLINNIGLVFTVVGKFARHQSFDTTKLVTSVKGIMKQASHDLDKCNQALVLVLGTTVFCNCDDSILDSFKDECTMKKFDGVPALAPLIGRALANAIERTDISGFGSGLVWLLGRSLEADRMAAFDPVDDGEWMTLIYAKWRSPLNRNLSDNVKQLDIICLLATYKSLTEEDCATCVSQCKNMAKSGDFSRVLLDALEVMMSVRNYARQTLQNNKEQFSSIISRGKALLGLTPASVSNRSTRKESIMSFLKSPISWDAVRQQIGLQMRMIDSLRKSMEMIAKLTSNMMEGTEFVNLIWWNLANKTSFPGLEWVYQNCDESIVTELSGQIRDLVKIVIEGERRSIWCKLSLPLTCFRMLRDCHDAKLNAEVFNMCFNYIDKDLSYGLACFTVQDATQLPSQWTSKMSSMTVRQWRLVVMFLRGKIYVDGLSEQLLDTQVDGEAAVLVKKAIALQTNVDNNTGKYALMYRDMLMRIGKRVEMGAVDGDSNEDVMILRSIMNLPDCSNRRCLRDELRLINLSSEKSLQYGFLGLFAANVRDDVHARLLDGTPIMRLMIRDKQCFVSEDFRIKTSGMSGITHVMMPVGFLNDNMLVLRMHEFLRYTMECRSDPLSPVAMKALRNIIVDAKCRSHLGHLEIRAWLSGVGMGSFSSLGRLETKIQGLRELGHASQCETMECIEVDDRIIYLSPPLRRKGYGEMTIRPASDSIEVPVVVYSVTESKTDNLFSVCDRMEVRIGDGKTLTIDISSRRVTLDGDNTLAIPSGFHVRIGIATPVNMIFDVSKCSYLFAEHQKFVERSVSGLRRIPTLKPLYVVPNWAQDAVDRYLGYMVPARRHNLQLNFECNPLRRQQRENPLMKISDVRGMSDVLKRQIIESYTQRLTEGYFAIATLNLFSDGRYVPMEMEEYLTIFVHLVVNFERLSRQKMMDDMFPFDLDGCLWDNDYELPTNTFLDTKKVKSIMTIIVSKEGFTDRLCFHLKASFNHLSSHFPRRSKPIENRILQSWSCAFAPYFTDSSQGHIYIDGGYGSALTVFTHDTEKIVTGDTQLAQYQMNGDTQADWIYESPYEFLLLLKCFIHLAQTPAHFDLIKAIFVDAMVIGSPFLCTYADEFLHILVGMTSVNEPNMDITTYTRATMLVRLRETGRHRSRIPAFAYSFCLEEVQKIVSVVKFLRDIGPHFPEFGGQEAQEDEGVTYTIARSDINESGSTQNVFHMKEIQALLRSYECLESFPFWIFFKFWITLRKPQQPSKPVSFTIEEIRDDFLRDCRALVFDWKRHHTQIVLDSLPVYNVFKDELLTVVQRLTRGPLSECFSRYVITIMTFALRQVNLMYATVVKPGMDRMLGMMFEYISFHTLFAHFTNRISTVRSPDFVPRIVIDRSIVRYQLDGDSNGIKNSIVAQVTRAFEGISESRLRCVPLPWKVRFEGEAAIDAGGPARELFTEFAGSIFDPSSGLTVHAPTRHDLFIPRTQHISEAGAQYRAIGVFIGIVARTGLCQNLPFAPLVWKFLASETITEEDVTSIDDGLCDMFAAVRRASNDRAVAESLGVEWSVSDWAGTLCILSGHEVGAPVREHEYDLYIRECLAFRIDAIVECLRPMKAGFLENIGAIHVPYFKGAFLSRLCQGDDCLPVSTLQSRTSYMHFKPTDLPVQLFWQVFEQMDGERRSLLLRFIAAITRLPVGHSLESFQLGIHRSVCEHPDQSFIRASTCFNRLYLPCYTNFNSAWDRINLSIDLSPTMERS